MNIDANISSLDLHKRGYITTSYQKNTGKDALFIEKNEYTQFISYTKKTKDDGIPYKFGDKVIGKVSTPNRRIVDCIKRSEAILTLEDNWDTEGSIGFSETTWKVAVVFLIEYSKQLTDILGYVIDIPKIYPGPNGSIDIDWETSTYGLIINIAEGGEVATYYGDNQGRQMTEGVFNPNNFNILLLPMAVQL